MRRLAGVMLDAVEEQFAREGQPPWPSLRPSTIRARARRGHWPGKILQETGRLAASITSSWGRDEAVVGTSVVYGLYHQFGTRTMPARPFLRLTAEDLQRLLEEVVDWAGL
jgi:phage virion morphogenesis protein